MLGFAHALTFIRPVRRRPGVSCPDTGRTRLAEVHGASGVADSDALHHAGSPSSCFRDATPRPEAPSSAIDDFGGGGGSVDANIQRWLGQMQQPDGRATSDVATKEAKTINGLKVSAARCLRNLRRRSPAGSHRETQQPRLPQRAWPSSKRHVARTTKLVGPAAVVETWNKSFNEFLASLHSCRTRDWLKAQGSGLRQIFESVVVGFA